MLGNEKIMAFVGVSDAERARAFYRDTLGLKLISEDGFALAFNVQGVMLRVTLVHEVAPHAYTVLGWQVDDVTATAQALLNGGLTFERFPRLTQDELGIWTAPGGARIAWFKDPDGNILSVTQL